MGVGIDEAGEDRPARRIDHLGPGGRLDPAVDPLNRFTGAENVGGVPTVGIDDLSVFDQQRHGYRGQGGDVAGPRPGGYPPKPLALQKEMRPVGREHKPNADNRWGGMTSLQACGGAAGTEDLESSEAGFQPSISQGVECPC